MNNFFNTDKSEPYYIHLSIINNGAISIMKFVNGKEILIGDSLTIKSAFSIVKELNSLTR